MWHDQKVIWGKLGRQMGDKIFNLEQRDWYRTQWWNLLEYAPSYNQIKQENTKHCMARYQKKEGYAQNLYINSVHDHILQLYPGLLILAVPPGTVAESSTKQK